MTLEIALAVLPSILLAGAGSVWGLLRWSAQRNLAREDADRAELRDGLKALEALGNELGSTLKACGLELVALKATLAVLDIRVEKQSIFWGGKIEANQREAREAIEGCLAKMHELFKEYRTDNHERWGKLTVALATEMSETARREAARLMDERGRKR